MEKHNYEFRKLKATDIFLITKLISNINLQEIAEVFYNSKTNVKKDENVNEIDLGINIALKIGNVILKNLNLCEHDLFKLLAETSNLDVKMIEDLDIDIFINMIADFVKKDEFVGLLKGALKLIK